MSDRQAVRQKSSVPKLPDSRASAEGLPSRARLVVHGTPGQILQSELIG